MYARLFEYAFKAAIVDIDQRGQFSQFAARDRLAPVRFYGQSQKAPLNPVTGFRRIRLRQIQQLGERGARVVPFPFLQGRKVRVVDKTEAFQPVDGCGAADLEVMGQEGRGVQGDVPVARRGPRPTSPKNSCSCGVRPLAMPCINRSTPVSGMRNEAAKALARTSGRFAESRVQLTVPRCGLSNSACAYSWANEKRRRNG